MARRKVRRVRRARGESNVQHIPTEEELKDEYAYVLRDLRRVFILAGIMFAVLILLNLLI
jgi:hypothetical protein